MIRGIFLPGLRIAPCRECRGYDIRKWKKRADADQFHLPAAARPPAKTAFEPTWEHDIDAIGAVHNPVTLAAVSMMDSSRYFSDGFCIP